MFRSRGFTTAVITALLVGFLIPLTAGWLFSIFYERNQAQHDLRLRHERILTILAANLKEPLLTFSPENASRAVRLLMQDEAIANVRVYSGIFEMDLANFHRTDLLEGELLTSRKHILSGGEVLGFVEVSMSTIPMEKTLADKRIMLLVVFSSMLLCGLLIILPLLWKKALNPLSRLVDDARHISNGRLETPLKWKGADEFSELGKTLESMRESLYNSFCEIESLAATDELTGVPNRRKFREAATRELELAHRYGTPLSLVLLDIDHFKYINDTYGHATGDTILVELCRLIEKDTRGVDIFARWGGEEFVLLLPETSPTGASAVAEKLRMAVESHSFSETITLTCSFGTSSFWPNDSLYSLLERADNALYKAKQAGRNQVVQL